MWTSKLGKKYPKEQIQQQDQASQRELKRLRGLKCRLNDLCADCGRQDSSWSSVSLGVFICVTCSDVHRSVGTHITKVKGCTGTYLWGPDELDRMREVGNDGAEKMYGDSKISPTASKEEKQQFVIDKYEKRAFVNQCSPNRAQQKRESRVPPVTSPLVPQLGLNVPVVRRAGAPQPQQKIQPSRHHEQAIKTGSAAQAVPLTDAFFDDFFNELEDSKVQPKLSTHPSDVQTVEVKSSCQGSDLDQFLNSALAQGAPKQPTVKTEFAFDLEWPI